MFWMRWKLNLFEGYQFSRSFTRIAFSRLLAVLSDRILILACLALDRTQDFDSLFLDRPRKIDPWPRFYHQSRLNASDLLLG